MKVGYLEYPEANIKLPINFSAKSGTFTCTYSDTKYEHKERDALKALVLSAIKAAYTMTWRPVIVVTLSNEHSHERVERALLSRERIYVGSHEALGYKQVHWTCREEDRLAQSRDFPLSKFQALSLPFLKERSFSTTIYLDYDEETWNALSEIEKILRALQNGIRAQLQSREGIFEVLTSCQRLFKNLVNGANSSSDGEASRSN